MLCLRISAYADAYASGNALDFSLNHFKAYKRLKWLYKDKNARDLRIRLIQVHFKGASGDIRWRVCEKAFLSLGAKRKRVKKRLDEMLVSPKCCFFVTFTIKPDVLRKNSEESLRKYVQRWLNANCEDYVCNVDYGDLYGRIHFHALVYAPKRMDFSSYNSKYGALQCRKILTSKKDKLMNYVSKFVNHCTKWSTHFERIMMKRRKVWAETYPPDFLFDDD